MTKFLLSKFLAINLLSSKIARKETANDNLSNIAKLARE